MKNKILMLALAALALAGCKQNEMMDNEVPDGLYFHYGAAARDQHETYNLTFAYMSDTVWLSYHNVRLYATGQLRDYVRAVNFVQVLDGDHDAIALPADKEITETKAWLYRQAQKAGKDLSTPAKVDAATATGITAHYVAFDHPKYIEYLLKYTSIGQDGIPQYLGTAIDINQREVVYPLLFLKDPSLSSLTTVTPAVDDTHSMDLKIKLANNQYFEQGLVDRDFVGRRTDYAVFFDNLTGEPSTWESFWKPFLGAWGPVKFQYLRTATGYNNWLLDNGGSPQLDQIRFMISSTQQLINEYNSKYPTLTEPIAEGKAYSGKPVGANAPYDTM